jgi:hypothetical protein
MVAPIAQRTNLAGVFVSRSVCHCVTSKRPPGTTTAPRTSRSPATITWFRGIYPVALIALMIGSVRCGVRVTLATTPTGY